jgi:hypothetical protein
LNSASLASEIKFSGTNGITLPVLCQLYVKEFDPTGEKLVTP